MPGEVPVLVHNEGAQPRRVVDRRPPGGISPQPDVEVDPALLDEGASPRSGAWATCVVNLERVPGGSDAAGAGGPETALGDRQVGAHLRGQLACVGAGWRLEGDRRHGQPGGRRGQGAEGQRAQQGAPDGMGSRHGAGSWGPHRACLCRVSERAAAGVSSGARHGRMSSRARRYPPLPLRNSKRESRNRWP